MLFQDVDDAVKELIAFKKLCPYYFGLKTEEWVAPSGIPDFPQLHNALNFLEKWASSSKEIRMEQVEEAKKNYHYIINALANKDFSTAKGNKGLHLPAKHACKHLVASLIQAGAEVDACDAYGNSALTHCVTAIDSDDKLDSNRLRTIEILLDAGANIKHTSPNDIYDDLPTPLLFALKHGIIPVLQLMLNHPKTDPSAKDSTGIAGPLRMPLVTLSVAQSKYNCLKVLIDKGANINQLDNNGKSPLFWAIDKKNIPIIFLLLESGAKLDQATSGLLDDLYAYGNNLTHRLLEDGLRLNDKPTTEAVDNFNFLQRAIISGKTHIKIPDRDSRILTLKSVLSLILNYLKQSEMQIAVRRLSLVHLAMKKHYAHERSKELATLYHAYQDFKIGTAGQLTDAQSVRRTLAFSDDALHIMKKNDEAYKSLRSQVSVHNEISNSEGQRGPSDSQISIDSKSRPSSSNGCKLV